MIINTPEGIAAYRLLTFRSRLMLESKGLTTRGPSALSLIKKETGLKGTTKTMMPKYEAWLRERGILSEA